MRLLLATLVTSAMFLGSRATADVMTVSDLVRIALAKSQEVQGKVFETDALKSTAERMKLGENPTLSLEIANREHSLGRAQGLRASLVQPLGLGRAGVQGRAADLRAEISEFEGQTLGLKLHAQLYEDIYRYMAADEKAKHAEERVVRFQNIKRFLGSRSFVSPQKKAEALIVAAKIQILNKEFLHLRAERDVLWETLNAFVGLKERPEIKASWFRGSRKFDFESMWKSAQTKFPGLQVAQLKTRQAEAESEAAKKEKWRGVAVSGFFSGESGPESEKIYGLGLAIPLPVFDSGSALVRSRELEKKAANTRAAFALRSAERDLRSALIHYATARDAVVALPFSSIPSLESSMKEADLGFRRGQVDLLTYIEAENQHSDSLAVIFDAQAEFARELAVLSYMTADVELLEEK
jgi:outer membrane protein TolC